MEPNCANCGHGDYRHWKPGSTACELCDCKQMIYPKHGDKMTQPQIDTKTYLRKAIEGNEDIQYWQRELLITEDQVDRIIDIVNQAVQQMPRSSPQVAPGLRELSVLANWVLMVLSDHPKTESEMRASFSEYPSEEVDKAINDLVRKNLIAADGDGKFKVAAAQGGQVDRDAIRNRLDVERDFAEKARAHAINNNLNSLAIIHSEYAADFALLIQMLDRGDFNSAVPSAPECECVKKAWAAFHHEEITGAQIPNQWDYCYAELKHSIEALGTPQGSDSQQDGCELIRLERRRQIEVEKWHEDHDDNEHADGQLAVAAACYTVAQSNKVVIGPNGKDAWPWEYKFDKRDRHHYKKCLVIAGALIAAELDRWNRLCQKRSDEMLPILIGEEPEPAQPVADGEAQERGDVTIKGL